MFDGFTVDNVPQHQSKEMANNKNSMNTKKRIDKINPYQPKSKDDAITVCILKINELIEAYNNELTTDVTIEDRKIDNQQSMNTREDIREEFVSKMQGGGAISVYDWESIADWFLERTIPKSDIEKIIGKHNARILNEFQLQGKPDMPIIAYDERVCLVPAMEIATKETLQAFLSNPNKQ